FDGRYRLLRGQSRGGNRSDFLLFDIHMGVSSRDISRQKPCGAWLRSSVRRSVLARNSRNRRGRFEEASRWVRRCQCFVLPTPAPPRKNPGGLSTHGSL